MDTTVARSPIGHLLNGRYRVESHIARGGMADVYVGTDTRLDRPVALKIMRAELANDEDFVRRFIGEARSVARLSHPNVVAVYDQGADGRTLYLAMEYVRGQSLRALLDGRGRLAPAEALDIMEGVLAALAAAHDAGLAHRDVKPENVLLTQSGAIKVVDFGLARLVAAASHTKTGMIIGTAAYLAPEQVAHGAADARSDVYAAGIMLFELLTGRQPHTGETPLAVAYKHVNEMVPAPSSAAPGLPPALDMLVAMATSRDPELRPGDAGQFLSAIAGVRRSLPAATAAAPVPGGPWTVPGGGPGRAGAPALPAAPPAEPDGGATDLIPGMAPPARQSYGAPAATLPAATERYHPDAQEPPNQTLVVAPGGLPDHSGHGGPPDAYGPPPRHRGPREPGLQRLLFSRRLAYLAGGLVLAGAAALALWWAAAGRYTTVPQLTGQPVATAQSGLQAVGLTGQVSRRAQISNTVPRGDVIRTNPGGGSKVGRGGTVTLIVSAGPRMISMPEVTGQALAAAQTAIRQAGLVPGTVTRQTSATIPAGIVISTDPLAGVSWPQPRPVRLTVSAGPPLPDFVGQQKDVAEQWAQANGVSLNEVAVNSNQPAGTITHQSPPAGDAFTQGEVITVSFSNGPPTVAIPNVDGMPADQAQKQLEQLGFQVTVNKVGPLDTVFNYSPNGQAPQGSTITLWVGLP
ncbi:MAG: protein kinase domain-containing protein [Gemmatimonadota bacterium]